jgi:hypothetical protein
MGQEVVYCFKCGTRLKGADFDKGSAFKIGDKTCCATCAVGLLTSLPSEEQEQILKKVMSSESASTKKLVVQGEVVTPDPIPVSGGGPQTPVPTPRPGLDTTSKTKLATPRLQRPTMMQKITNRAIAGGRGGKMIALFVGAGVLVAALIGILVSLGGGRRGPTHSIPVAERAIPEENLPAVDTTRKPDDKPSDPTPHRPAVPSSATREETARQSLERARSSDPADMASKVRLYQQAVWDSEGTTHFEAATKELAPLLEKWKARLTTELAKVDETVRPLADQEQYRSALESLDKARKTYADADWTAPIDKKIASVRKSMDDSYQLIKPKAVDAKKKGDTATVTALTERVAKWGMTDYASDLKKSLDEIAGAPTADKPIDKPVKPDDAPRKPEDEGKTYAQRWEQAMAIAALRDYTRAAKELEQATGPIQDGALRGEALADIEALRSASAMLNETLDILADWPEGRALPVKYIDETGSKKTANDPVIQSNRHRAELKKGRTGSHWIEFADVDADSLAKIFKARKNKQKTDGRSMAYFCLFEGDVESAKNQLGEPVSVIPEKYWALGKRVAEQRAKAPKPDADKVKKEREARDMLYAAEKEFRVMSTRINAVDKYKTLLGALGETDFVKRHQDFIKARSEGDKEYVLTAKQLSATGAFKINRDSKDGAEFYLSEFDTERGRDNYVDIEFYASAGNRYQLHLYIGGCCNEVLSFNMQGSEMTGTNSSQQTMSCEPGSSSFITVNIQAPNFPATHGAHGGRKEPAQWFSTTLRIPNYQTPGMKKVRISTTHMGFGVKYALVTSIRQRPPTLQDMKKLASEQ